MTTWDHLSHLEGARLVRRVDLESDLEYLFRHALVQDAVYASLLRADRKRLHRAVAETLAARQPDNPNLAALLAAHFAAADEPARALHFYREAAAQAAARYANAEAAAHYAQAIALARQLNQGAAELLPLYRDYGRTLELHAQNDAALATYRDQETVAQVLGDSTLEAAALVAQALLHATPNALHDPAQAQALLDRAAPLIQAAGDRAAEARRLWVQTLVHMWNHDMAAALVTGEASLALARAEDLPEQIAYTLNDLYGCYMELRRFDDAAAASAEVVDRWRALGNLPMLADALINQTELRGALRDYARVLALTDEALAISQMTGNVWGQAYAYFARSMSLFHLGSLGEARQTFQRCVDLAGQAGFVFAQVIAGGMLAWLHAQLGAPERAEPGVIAAMRLADEKLPTARALPRGVLLWLLVDTAQWDRAAALVADPTMAELLDGPTNSPAGFSFALYLALGEWALAEGRLADAHAQSERALAVLRAMPIMPSLVDALEFAGRVRLAQGDLAGARAVLDEVRDSLEPAGARRMLWAIYRTLAAVAAAEGDASEAARHRATARAELAYLIGQIDDPALRQSFLGRPAVCAVWEEPSARSDAV